MSGIVVFFGTLPAPQQWLESLAKRHGWALYHTATLNELSALSPQDIVAVLFDPNDLNSDWHTALKQVVKAVPDALPIICLRFSDSNRGHETPAGAYYILHYPFAFTEISHCFGFVHQAQHRRQKLDLSGLTAARNGNVTEPEDTRETGTGNATLRVRPSKAPAAKSKGA